MTLTLSQLLQPLLSFDDKPEGLQPVSQLQLDSRKVKEGDVFVAIKGHALDGRRFIDSAIMQGAIAVVADADDTHPHGWIAYQQQVPIIYVQDLNQHLSLLAQSCYQYHPMKLIGITGTNGKTTVSQLIAQWISLLGKKAAVMGTTGNGFLEALQESDNTTGSAIDIQRTLADMHQQGAEYTALEISSHGLVQGRVKALDFSVAAFTNLTRDHLDYHGTMEAYAQAKLSLFTHHSCQYSIINYDDPTGQQWLKWLPQAIAVSLSPLSLQKGRQGLWAEQVQYSDAGIQIKINGSWGRAQLDVPLIGAFNASNVILALSCLLALGFDLSSLAQQAPKLTPVIGRMELFQSLSTQAKMVVDYAHTPDALEKALQALRVHCQGQLWCIVGCGGDRDPGKRPMMASVAERLADKVIFTDDNPRSEDPQTIMEDMLAGTQYPQKIHQIHDRFKACEYALTHAHTQDIILIAGKGHEDYQIICDQKRHYSDRETAQTLLGITS